MLGAGTIGKEQRGGASELGEGCAMHDLPPHNSYLLSSQVCLDSLWDTVEGLSQKLFTTRVILPLQELSRILECVEVFWIVMVTSEHRLQGCKVHHAKDGPIDERTVSSICEHV